ncbi:MFS transporter [Mucilaginibacter sp. JRF]|uniref:MFS transporter n=1 Tax=Mucilaginibacter sp. JRF TaxID=2780088 RepID=UPI00187DE4E0|nr:MFS transporter [Mucilaginibacter sp. JRF]MBE9583757.1 MFS transporter [Mucilaginibacter sp. JRF]
MAAEGNQQVFKSWVPEWGARGLIFLVMLPSLGLFGLSMANSSAAAGFYGIEPTDVQYSMILFYAAVASFYSFETRIFSYIDVKTYLIISTLVEIVTSYICYSTHNIIVLFIFRFIQGLGSCACTSISISLIFSRLKSERAREIGYSVFYGVLQLIAQFTTLISAPVIDAADYNVLYKCVIFLYLPGTIALYFILNNVRLQKRIPLYGLDWVSFVLYAAAIALTGFVLIYGQQRYWFHDKLISMAVLMSIFIFIVYGFRQRSLYRPYLSLNIFKYKNYWAGVILLFVLYLCRGALNVTTGYFAGVLGLDPQHTGYMLISNIIGVILGVLVSSRLTLMKLNIRFVWMVGFVMLLTFQLWMMTLFTTQANTSEFIIPLLLHGFGAGILMVPIILFMVSSVPKKLAKDASGTGVLIRFAGFCTSIALINIYTDYGKNQHYNRFLQGIEAGNVNVGQRIAAYTNAVQARGLSADRAGQAANAILYKSMNVQMQIRTAMEYYQWLSCLVLAVLIFIAIYPYVNRTTINVKQAEPASAGI